MTREGRLSVGLLVVGILFLAAPTSNDAHLTSRAVESVSQPIYSRTVQRAERSSPRLVKQTTSHPDSVLKRRTAMPEVSNVEVAVQYALSQVGKRYVWGTPLRSPRQSKVIQSNSYDCSGLTWAAYRAAGITIGTVTLTQIRNGMAVSRGELKRGDLVFPDPGHVQIYLGNGTVVHAPNSRSLVRIDPLGRRFYAARRIVGGGQSSSGAFVPVTGVRDTVGGFTNAINVLTDENTWRRGFMVFLGVLLLLPVLIQLRKTVGYA